MGRTGSNAATIDAEGEGTTVQRDLQGVDLHLLGGFEARVGGVSIPLATGSQRLVAFVALSPPPVRRALAAGVLWPEVPDAQSCASLRSAISRLGPAGRRCLRITPLDLGLAERVRLDLTKWNVVARRLLGPEKMDVPHCDAVLPALCSELLPGWYEDWVTVRAESWHQLRLHALEALAMRLAAEARYADAIMAALASVEGDPLRESAWITLMRVHLAEGNQSEAVREFDRYRELLGRELGLEPTRRLQEFLANRVCSAPTRRGAGGWGSAPHRLHDVARLQGVERSRVVESPSS